MAKEVVKVEGLREVEKSLLALGKNTAAKSVARRVARQALKPMLAKARQLAPDDPRTPVKDLRRSIIISGRLNPTQNRMAYYAGKSAVELHVGTNDPAGVQQEFGNVNHGPQPFMRPAWASTKMQVLEIVKTRFSAEIAKQVAKLAKG